LRTDPHPAWDRSWTRVTFNACPKGHRQVFVAASSARSRRASGFPAALAFSTRDLVCSSTMARSETSVPPRDMPYIFDTASRRRWPTAQAGKDLYVQKPASHRLFEGRKMVEAARKYKRIVQCPSGSRSPRGRYRKPYVVPETV
jgi:hypothetical protein